MNTSKRGRKPLELQQTIEIQPGWTIRRFDELNWQIKWPTQTRTYYYGSLEAALRDLPRKLMLKETISDLKGILSAMDRIQETIDRMVISAKFLE